MEDKKYDTNEFNITRQFEGTAKEIRENMPSLKIGSDDKKPVQYSPEVEKFRKWMLYVLSGLVILTVAIYVIVKIISRLF